MSNEILDEVYAARERLWQRGGGTVHGVCEYLRECGRRAKARGVLWIESEEEREAIGAEVRARLAAEGTAMGVGEAEAGAYVAREGKALRAVKREKRKVKNGGKTDGFGCAARAHAGKEREG